MTRSMKTTVALAVLALAMTLGANRAQAQGFSFGVGGGSGGVGVGIGAGNAYGYYGRGYYGRDYYGAGIGGPGYYGYYGRGGYGPGYYGPGYYYARPGVYWYADRGWDRWGSYYDDRYEAPAEQAAPRRDETPPLPTAAELANMNWKYLRRVLRFGAGALEDELDKMKNGAGWKKHLQVGAVRDAVAEDGNSPPDGKTIEKLAKLSAVYDKVAANNEYAVISRLWGFQTTAMALVEMSKPAWRRQLRQLAEASRALDSELESLSTGAGWSKHLALPHEVFAILDAEKQADELKQPDPAALGKALARFDAVSKNPEYKKIAETPSFRATHELLEGYLTHFVAAPNAPPPASD